MLRFLAIVICVLFLALPGVVAKEFMFRASSAPATYSTQLGVMALPVYVIINNARHQGLYINTAPSLQLGKDMGLHEGMVLLTLGGYSIYSTKAADDWVKQHRQGKAQYTYVVMVGGKPTIRTGQSQVTATLKQSTYSAHSESSPASADELETYSLALINESRRREGLSTLQQDSSLARLARQYAEYMAQHPREYDVFGSRGPHIDLQGRSPADRAQEAGISYFQSENIGRGTRGGIGESDRGTIRTVHMQMMAEPVGVPNHRSNIMDVQAHRVGIGVARTSGRLYMAQEFGN